MRTFNEKRKDKKLIRIGDITIGGKNDIAIQSMTNTDTRNLNATINQIAELKDQGCDIVRISVFDKECIQNIRYTFKKREEYNDQRNRQCPKSY